MKNRAARQAERSAKDEVEVSDDAFHRGAFRVLQPVGTGHRSGLDALLIAASLPEDASGLLADLGSGAGVAGLAALASNPRLEVHLVEKNPLMAELARKTLKLRQNLQFAPKTRVIEADVTLSGTRRTSSGLQETAYDHVIMNPPYNHENQRSSPDLVRSEAHVMGLFGLDAWMRTAVAILKPGATLNMIYRTEKLAEILACAQGRFGGMVIVPIHSRAGDAAKRILVRMTKGSRAPMAIMPGIIMHDDEGRPTKSANALLNGEARIDFG